MFSLFKAHEIEEFKEPVRGKMASPFRCKSFHREVPEGDRGVYVEVRDDGECKIYISSFGVTPGYTNLPYDRWCRESLTESYVFANIDTAKLYLKDRRSELLSQLDLATQPYIHF